MSFFGSIGKGLAQLDVTSRKSFAGKATAAVGTGGLSLLSRKTVLGKVGTGIANSVHDSQAPIAIGGNALGAAVGVRGATTRLAANVASVKRQVPVVLGAAKGAMAGGIPGAIIGGAATIGATYVAPQFVPRAPSAPAAPAATLAPAAPATPASTVLPGATAAPARSVPLPTFSGSRGFASGAGAAAPAAASGAVPNLDLFERLGIWLRRSFGG